MLVKQVPVSFTAHPQGNLTDRQGRSTDQHPQFSHQRSRRSPYGQEPFTKLSFPSGWLFHPPSCLLQLIPQSRLPPRAALRNSVLRPSSSRGSRGLHSQREKGLRKGKRWCSRIKACWDENSGFRSPQSWRMKAVHSRTSSAPQSWRASSVEIRFYNIMVGEKELLLEQYREAVGIALSALGGGAQGWGEGRGAASAR